MKKLSKRIQENKGDFNTLHLLASKNIKTLPTVEVFKKYVVTGNFYDFELEGNKLCFCVRGAAGRKAVDVFEEFAYRAIVDYDAHVEAEDHDGFDVLKVTVMDAPKERYKGEVALKMIKSAFDHTSDILNTEFGQELLRIAGFTPIVFVGDYMQTIGFLAPRGTDLRKELQDALLNEPHVAMTRQSNNYIYLTV